MTAVQPEEADGLQILTVTGRGYVVSSATQPGLWWTVYGHECACPAGQAGDLTCAHRRAVAALVKYRNEAQRRPTLPPAPPGVFVD